MNSVSGSIDFAEPSLAVERRFKYIKVAFEKQKYFFIPIFVFHLFSIFIRYPVLYDWKPSLLVF